MSEKKDKAYPSQFDKVKEITDKLEAGIQALFESEAFKNYLKTLSKFHDYSLCQFPCQEFPCNQI